jgi:hypothetical protein
MYVLHHEGRLKGTAPCTLGVTELIYVTRTCVLLHLMLVLIIVNTHSYDSHVRLLLQRDTARIRQHQSRRTRHHTLEGSLFGWWSHLV